MLYRGDELNLGGLPQPVCRTARRLAVGLVLLELAALAPPRIAGGRSRMRRMNTPVPPTGLRPAQLARSERVLLLVDFINPLDFPGGDQLAPHAVAAARCTAAEMPEAKSASLACISDVLRFDRAAAVPQAPSRRKAPSRARV